MLPHPAPARSTPPSEKRCTRCELVKPLDEFPPAARHRDGRSSWCRSCKNEATKDWRDRNRERLNAARRKGPTALTCSECGVGFEGRPDRLICSRRCKDRRYARLHPDKARAKWRRHQRNRRERRTAAA